MLALDLEIYVTPSLGDSTFLLRSGEQALVVDPQRDVARVLDGLLKTGATLRFILETHLHNDYVSGARELSAATGAQVVAPSSGGYAFPHRGVAEGDEIMLGDLRLVAIATPGHTPEHLSYGVHRLEQSRVLAVFTGGSLIVGATGRTDLLGPELTDELTRAQYRSVRRLAALPEDVQLLPTHGSGSFCAAGPPSRDRTSTVGRELERNPALADPDESSFVKNRLSGLLDYPAYYTRMGAINRSGPGLVGSLPPPRPLAPETVSGAMERGVWLVDGRDRREFAAAHVPGSVNIELGRTFAAYVGWILPFDAPLTLVLPHEPKASWSQALTELFRVGYEHVRGYLEGGVDGWRASGRSVASYPVSTIDDLCRARREGRADLVLDVRQKVEWDRAHIPGSRHVFVADLPKRVSDVQGDHEVWAICASGQRSSIAASLLDRAGIQVRLVDQGGVKQFLAACPP
jgi:hydroxyacylglutathione hydrolase